MWVIGIKPRSSGKVATTGNYQATSSVLSPSSLKLWVMSLCGIVKLNATGVAEILGSSKTFLNAQ